MSSLRMKMPSERSHDAQPDPGEHNENEKGKPTMSTIHSNPVRRAQESVEQLSDDALSMVTGGYPENAPQIAILNRALEDILPDGMIPLPKAQSDEPAPQVGSVPVSPAAPAC